MRYAIVHANVLIASLWAIVGALENSTSLLWIVPIWALSIVLVVDYWEKRGDEAR